MTTELYTLMLLEIAALAALLLISGTDLPRSSPSVADALERLLDAVPAASSRQFPGVAVSLAWDSRQKSAWDKPSQFPPKPRWWSRSPCAGRARGRWEKYLWGGVRRAWKSPAGRLAVGSRPAFDAIGTLALIAMMTLSRLRCGLIYALSRRPVAAFVAVPDASGTFPPVRLQPLHLFDTLAAIFVGSPTLVVSKNCARTGNGDPRCCFLGGDGAAAIWNCAVSAKTWPMAWWRVRSPALLSDPRVPLHKRRLALPLTAGGHSVGTLLLVYQRPLPRRRWTWSCSTRGSTRSR